MYSVESAKGDRLAETRAGHSQAQTESKGKENIQWGKREQFKFIGNLIWN